jgi:2',3'-cyclic-nucleotide 2'-phosphodiesterase (5'-nucleotidase family)
MMSLRAIFRSRALGLAALLSAGAALLSACEAGLEPAPKTAAAGGPVSITILYTSDEHGWLAPLTEKGRVRGGAAEILGQWIAREGHCPGRPESPETRRRCADPETLLLSGGDNWTGPAISSFYAGLPMAEAMDRMGYAASAFGNHEFDFGRDQFMKNRARGGFPYLAANMRVTDPALAGLDIKPFLVFERRGVKIGVVGLATDTTLTSALASRFEGIAFEEAESALGRAVSDAWSAGPDALIAIIHECPDHLASILERHPEWRLSFVGGGHCHRVIDKRVGAVPLISPGWRLQSYVRVRMTFDKARPPRERVISVAPEIIEVSRAEGAPADGPSDEAIASIRRVWQERLDKALGEAVGYTSTGIEQRSAQMARWIGETWRQELGADIAIVNDGALRQAVPKGVITRATIYSVMPFDNTLVVCSITGKDLMDNLANQETLFSGLARLPDGRFSLSSGEPIEPNRKYTVVTIDFLYSGGAGFEFRKQDPKAKQTGLDWRTPVIEWMKRQQTTPESPLEKRISP